VWQGGGPINDIAEGLPRGASIPLLPDARRTMEMLKSADGPEANCLPTGVPRQAPYPWRIVQTPTHLFFQGPPTVGGDPDRPLATTSSPAVTPSNLR